MRLKREAMCGALRIQDLDRNVTLNGWVNRVREVGGVVFVNLRDQEGLIQLVFDREEDQALHAKAKELGREDVLAIKGKVRRRAEGQENKELATGEVEVLVQEFELLNKSETPPIEVKEGLEIDQELRQRYRFLDLRRPSMQATLRLRHRIVKTLRDYFDQAGFLEVETPYLTKATPEGARDFVVPARQHPGLFYALPQSPQIFKQILMCSGVDKYIQVVRCFRDEATRASRQPEFTQLDLEMCFVEEGDVQSQVESALQAVMQEVLELKFELPLQSMPYAQAMGEYGSDCPDTRFEMKLIDLKHNFQDSSFQVFAQTVKNGGTIKALRIPGGHSVLSKGQFKKLEKDAKGRRAKGLAFIRVLDDGSYDSSFIHLLSPEEQQALKEKLGLTPGDLVLLIADRDELASSILSEYRSQFAAKLELYPEDSFQYLWVNDFPLFEYDEETQRLYAAHHPFTSPSNEEALFELAEEMRRNNRVLSDRALELATGIKARAYDLVLNGLELGGGSIRIHKSNVQSAMFDCLGIGPEEAEAKFGFLLNALRFGAPPMGGIALGIDRFVRLLLGKKNIQEVIAFPKTASGQGLMDGSPASISQEQLDELQLQFVQADKADK